VFLYILVSAICCVLLVFINTLMLCFVSAHCCPPSYVLLVFVNAPLLCFIGVRHCPFVAFYWCSSSPFYCTLLVFIVTFLMHCISAHHRILVALCWCSLAPPHYALLMFINAPFAMLCWSYSVPPC